MPGNLGFPAYCQALAALPASNAAIAKACGLTARGVCDLMRRFWQLGLVHPGSSGYRNCVIWHRGPGDAANSRVHGKKRPYANHILFASMMRALESARTAGQLGEDVGVSLLAAQTAIRHLRAAGLVYLSEWSITAHGRPVARYEIGKGQDVPKPPPQGNRLKWQRYTQRKAFKALAMNDAIIRSAA